jgi:hypothetical protein
MTTEAGGREARDDRVDRHMSELLGELRVALPGVQVLFAFLLVVPFSQRYSVITPFQEKVYFVTLLCTAAASLLLIAPSVHHRVQFRHERKERLIQVANQMAIAGLAFLALGMTGAVLLITDVLFAAAATVVVTGVTGAAFALFWYAIPLRRRLEDRS